MSNGEDVRLLKRNIRSALRLVKKNLDSYLHTHWDERDVEVAHKLYRSLRMAGVGMREIAEAAKELGKRAGR